MKYKYVIDGNYLPNKTLWISYNDRIIDEAWALVFSTKREASTVAFLVARHFLMYHSLGIPVPKIFSRMDSCLKLGTAEEMKGYMKKYKRFEKYIPLYESRWLGETNETHDN